MRDDKSHISGRFGLISFLVVNLVIALCTDSQVKGGSDLLPIDVEVANKGDAMRQVQRKQDSIAMEIKSESWEPWDFIIGQHNGHTLMRLVGSPVRCDVYIIDDTVCFYLSPGISTGGRYNLPDSSFNLLVTLGKDTGRYSIDIISDDSVEVHTRNDTWFVNVIQESKLPDDIALIQINNADKKLSNKIKRLVKTIVDAGAEPLLLNEGYYEGFDFKVLKSKMKKRRKGQYNYNKTGTLLAFRIPDKSIENTFHVLIDQYNSKEAEDGCFVLNKTN